MTDNNAKQEVSAYLQNLEDTGFFKEDEAIKEVEIAVTKTAHGFITPLIGGMTLEMVDLTSASMTAKDYIQKILSEGDSPTTIAVSLNAAEAIRSGVESAPKSITNDQAKAAAAIADGVRITANEAVADNSLMIYRKPAPQSMSVMGELDKLFKDAGITHSEYGVQPSE